MDNSVALVESIKGEDSADTKLLKAMAKRAYDFIDDMEWCERVENQYLAYGVGGIVAVFLVMITPSCEDVDSTLWVIVGDLPPAYIIVEDNPTPTEALDAYCVEMERWIEAVKQGGSVEELIPVNVPPTIENADQLSSRLDFVRSKIMPLMDKAGGPVKSRDEVL